ncbi:MAG: MBL fold metallo-hydrolase [Spirochaetaceae bacterium]|nr:MBL fold metallo-hydrolase [Spirochaetaceae bacterium]
MRFEFLGTGTSHGIPVIGCNCDCCRSSDSRDKRFRSSVWITEGDVCSPSTSILIDMGPDFRSQALKSSINRLDALLLTHGHADHLNGLDDIRIFSHTASHAPSSAGKVRVYPETKGEGLPVYGNKWTLQDVHQRFSYIFVPVAEGGGKPKLKTIDCKIYHEDNPLVIGGLSIIPVPLLHGHLETSGWLIFKNYRMEGEIGIAYLTDCNQIPDASLELLKGFKSSLQHLVIDGLRVAPHSTHFAFSEALAMAMQIGARQNWLTHLCHDMTHTQAQEYLKNGISSDSRACGFHCEPAYDGLVLTI